MIPADRDWQTVVVDLDGTALSQDGRPPEELAMVMAQLRQRGVRGVIATARPPRAALPYHRELGLELPAICYDGMGLYQPDGMPLSYDGFGAEAGEALLDWAAELQASAILEVRDVACADSALADRLYRAGRPYGAARVVDRLSRQMAAEAAQAHLVLRSPLAPGAEEQIRRLMGCHVAPGRRWITLFPAAACKWEAFLRLCNLLGLDPARSVAFGDGDNDARLLRHSGWGVAMEGASAAAVRGARDRAGPAGNGLVVYLRQWLASTSPPIKGEEE